MPPRFLERIQAQDDALKQLFGPPPSEPPPYCYSSRTSIASSSISTPPPYRRSDLPYSHIESPCIPRDSTILVVGASGWLGGHVVDQLLSNGYLVRGAVRDNRKAAFTTKVFNDAYGAGRYSAYIIPDMTVPRAYDAAMTGCMGVIHVAGVTTMSSDPAEVIPPTIMGVLNVLESAARNPNIRRVVYCSAVAAACDFSGKEIITSESWAMDALRKAWAPPPYELDRAWSVFSSSKLQAEQTVWKWYREKRPNFILNCVLPSMLWGSRVYSKIDSLSLSMHVLKSILEGRSQSISWIPAQYFADVQDAALVHVAALILPGVMNERLFVTASSYTTSRMVELVRPPYPLQYISQSPLGEEHELQPIPEASRAEELLIRMGRKGWTDINLTLNLACEQFL